MSPEALERKRARDRERYRAAHPSARAYVQRTEDMAREAADMGPPLPLNGVSELRAAMQRTARILAAAREGLDMDALCERFDATPSAITKVLSRGRVRVPRRDLPLGLPL